MNHPAILITSAGRRTSLLQSFLVAAHSKGWSVLAGDCDSLAPSLYLADGALRLPALIDPTYISTLLTLVRKHSIRMIVPTIDTELELLAAHAAEFRAAECFALISSPHLVQIAGDKWKTVTEYAKAGIRTPRSWLPGAFEIGELPENLFIKPRDGSASQHAFAVLRSKIAHKLLEVPNAIVQERLKGTEITIDGLIDFNGAPIHFVPRVRIKTVGGESIQGVTIAAEDVRDWLIRCMEVTASFGGIGPVTLQAFLTTDGPVLLEVNPRFGGGYPLTVAAGGDYPKWLLEMLDGKTVAPRYGEYKSDLYMTRYYVEHFTADLKWKNAQ